MTTLRLVSLLAGIAVGFAVGAYGVAYLVASSWSSDSAGPAPLTVNDRSTVSSEVPSSRVQIAFWSQRVADRPKAYLDLTLLGQAFAQRARETSDISYYARAEEALRRALGINAQYAPAAASLSSVLFSKHEFRDALAVARPIAGTAGGIQALATVGDARLALGQVGRAEAAYRELLAWSATPAAYSRLAFLADLRGRTDLALGFMDRAAKLARDSGDSGESLAWYAFQIGELSFRAGRIELAESHYRAALELYDDYPLALVGLAKAKAAEGDRRASIGLYRKVVAIVPSPETLAALGDVYTAAGMDRKARQQYSAVELVAKLARINRQVYNRQLALYYADHGLRLGEARRLALGELRVRKDVYGYDAAAWTLARSGRCRVALVLAKRSLRLGTKDPLLYFHRGYAEGCAGDRGAMREWYGRALELNPEFSVRWAPVARAALR